MKCLRSFLLQVFCTCTLLIPKSWSSVPQCSRQGSRLVRKVLEKNFYPVFEYHGVSIPDDCPLKKSRDLYHIQEQYKLYEHNSRWSCEVCGKAFYKQDFLDLHMENKHQDLLVKKESSVCLADYCQLFRCVALDVDRRNKHFWSKALCNAENMAKLRKKCLSLVRSCIPLQETLESHKQLYKEIVEETCSLINCKDYWKSLDYELSALEVLYYLTFTPILIFALGIYYYNIWEYYYGDESEQSDVDQRQKRRLSNNDDVPNLRKRYASSTFTY